MSSHPIKDKRVLITGSAGVIGKELVRLLISKSARVLSVDRLSLPEISVNHLQLDLSKDSLEELLDFQPQVIFHLAAAFERSKESQVFWPVNWSDNITLSHRIIDTAKRAGRLETFVFASSYLVYSPLLYLSKTAGIQAAYINENDPKDPRNITGAAKYYAEKELDFIKEYYNQDLRIVNGRIFRVYGCGSKDVISRWIRTALSDGVIELYNEENRFDFIFAQDVAEGLLRLAESSAQGPVNIGTGISKSIKEVLDILESYVPVKNRIVDHGSTEEFEASCADIGKLKELTGWVPSTSLNDGIKRVVEFERKRTTQETKK